MKKLINRVEDVLNEQLQGLAKAHPQLTLHQDPLYVTRTDAPVAGKVALLSGGGSGHEPMHCGYIGQGMLSGACPGEIFTSPTPDKMFECAMQIDGGEGVLLIIKNYTGDILNFETATELLHESGIKVTTVVVDDDVAVKDSLYTAGRRGVANTVLIEKLVGAAAERGDSLEACAELGRRLNNLGHSIGIALGACTVPAAGQPSFTLKDDEMEFGVGIHGEPGIDRRRFSSLDQTVDEMFDTLLENGAYSRTLRQWDTVKGAWQEVQQSKTALQNGDRVIALVNNLGATPLSELYGVYNRLAQRCEASGIIIERNLIGSYCTSLDMAGFSITLLKVDDETLTLWDAPVHTPALNWETKEHDMSLNRTQIVDWLYRCGDIFTKESDFLTGLDKEIGDADHGLNMHRGFSKVVEKLPSIADKDIGFILKNTGMTLLSNVGGASGPLFGTFFIRAAQVTQAHQSLTLDELYLMIREGADGVVNRGKAEPGDKTMCDVWLPVVDSCASPASSTCRSPPRWMPPAKWPSVRPTPPSLCRRVKAAPAISASAASDIRIPARPRCCLWFRCWPPPPKSKEIAMVNLVIVSHSARLGEGVGELARQMLINDGCKLAIAAGIDDPDSPIGTDPLKVMEAIESVADTDHVLVMMDIGSALLSAETALDLLDPAIAAKVRLCAAPLVEGTLAATVSAASGAGIDKVIADAMSALEAKRVQLGLPSPTSDAAPEPMLADDGDTKSVSVIINNHNGLHVRPASKLVAALAGFNADLLLEKNGKCVKPDSLNQIALLQVRRNDKLRLLAAVRMPTRRWRRFRRWPPITSVNRLRRNRQRLRQRPSASKALPCAIRWP